MSHEIWWLTIIGLATLAGVLAILAILIRRHGRTIETKAILDAIKGGRQQWDVEHQSLQADVKTIKGWVLRILNRFGFLNDLHLQEPPIMPPKPKDDA